MKLTRRSFLKGLAALTLAPAIGISAGRKKLEPPKIPDGYILCDGRTIDAPGLRRAYSELFNKDAIEPLEELYAPRG